MILNVGAIQKRKNIARLVEAFETVRSDWRLVLAGSTGYGAEEILARIERSPARERISCWVTSRRGTGRLVRARHDLRLSVAGRRLRHAGAGSDGRGRPVVTSNRSALPEVAGDAALLVDPDDAEALGRRLRRID